MRHKPVFNTDNISDAYSRAFIKLENDDYPLELLECSLNFPECRAERFLFMIGCPLLIALSLIGNSLTFSVMLREKLRHTATAVFIATLAVMDTIATVTGLTRHFILKTFGMDIRNLSPTSCCVHRFVLYLSLDTSSWLLAVIAVERFLAVCKPQKYKATKSASSALKVVAVLILLQAAFNMYVFWTRGKHWTEVTVLDGDGTKTVQLNCGYTSEQSHYFWNNVQGWLVMAWYCFIPFTVMLVLDIFIIKKLRSLHHSSVSRSGSGMSATGLAKQMTSMTRMLLSVTIYFVVITTPIFMFTMLQGLIFQDMRNTIGNTLQEEDDHKIATLELIDACLTLLLYLNHSNNFWLYCITGRRFRRELAIMLSCNKPLNRIASTKKLSIKSPTAQPKECGKSLEMGYHALPLSGSPMLLKSSMNEVHTTSCVNVSVL